MKTPLKPLLSLLIILISNFSLFAQNIQVTGKPFLDAVILNDLIENEDKKVLDILKLYTDKPITTIEEAKTAFVGNVFLLNQLDRVKLNKDNNNLLSGHKTNAGLIQGAGVGSTGIVSPDLAIKALGEFVAERFKEELNIAYINKFKEEVNKQPQLKKLFPETTVTLINTEPYNYTTFLKTLRESFEKDLEKSPDNLLALLTLDKGKVDKDYINAYNFLLISVESLAALRNGKSPINTLNDLDNSPFIDEVKDVNLKSTLKLIPVLSRSLNTAKSDGWVNSTDMKLLLNPSPNIRELFLGLMFEKEKENIENITFKIGGDTASLKTLLEKDPSGKKEYPQIKKFNQAITQIFSNAEIIKGALSSLKNKELQGQLSPHEYFSLLKSFFITFESGLEISSSIGVIVNPDIKDKYIPIANNALDIYQGVIEKNYGFALTNSLEIVNTLLPDNTYKSDIMKYGVFMVNMVDANTSDDMVAALETAALPVGSYQIKRNSISNISLNAFGGGFGGLERLTQNGLPDNVKRNSGAIGFTAPIGLSFSWGTKTDKKELTGSSFSIFLPVIDVGAVTAFRLADDESELLPKLAWSNVFSPGITFIYGFSKAPLSLGGGFQYGPQLREINTQTAKIESSALNFRLTLAVDIPVFNLHTKTDK